MDLALNLNAIERGAGLQTSGGVAQLLSDLLPYLYYGAALALLVYLVSGGIQLMLAKGDPKAVQGAQGKITNALTGFVIVILSYLLVNLLGRVFGISVFTEIFN